MKKIRLFLTLGIFLLVLSISVGSPMSEEDDEYDDDPEFPERKAAQQKLQELMEKQHQNLDTFTSATTTSTTVKPHRVPASKQKRKWVLAQDVSGYQVFSDGPRIYTELIRTRPMLRIRIDIPDTIRHVEKIYDKSYVELKIRNWNRVHKVHVRVPFGYQPEDLRVLEMHDHVDIIAPIYSDVSESGNKIRYK